MLYHMRWHNIISYHIILYDTAYYCKLDRVEIRLDLEWVAQFDCRLDLILNWYCVPKSSLAKPATPWPGWLAGRGPWLIMSSPILHLVLTHLGDLTWLMFASSWLGPEGVRRVPRCIIQLCKIMEYNIM